MTTGQVFKSPFTGGKINAKMKQGAITVVTGTPEKMSKRFFWTIGIIVIILVIMKFSYIYHTNLDVNTFMAKIRETTLFNRSEQKVLKKNIQEPEISKTKVPTGMWTVNAIGRLGNLMGEYATLYALAKMNGHQAYILPEMHNQLAKIFKITLPVFHSEVLNHIKWKNYGLHDWMSDEYRHIEGEYVHFRGYPCSFTFYHHIKDEILREFTFHDFIKEESNNYLRSIIGDRKNVTFVGIHVRRGDYVHVMPNTWKGVVADKGYLQKAMDYFRQKYENPLFVVTSNGMDWCKQNINNSLDDVHFAGDGKEGSPGRDFALLAHCNHTIMTIGTFGIWVGYLVGGETIYLSNYTLPDSPFLKLFKYEAAFLPEWIGIPADLSPLLNKKP
ncbi:galactoside alpha-(1,2)-fucosyltransferase 2-like [Eleutherodactylus coqui]|uniref:galactoside alpha-(1,2)-fucosyltransferase 2-like n=1 Tax=Eleutherodactylus coqui TaxID=57060 RepID=UPI003463791C